MKKQMPFIKPFLLLLNIMPDKIYNIAEEKIIDTNLIVMDQKIINALRALSNE
jgi:hypothetical protein